MHFSWLIFSCLRVFRIHAHYTNFYIFVSLIFLCVGWNNIAFHFCLTDLIVHVNYISYPVCRSVCTQLISSVQLFLWRLIWVMLRADHGLYWATPDRECDETSRQHSKVLGQDNLVSIQARVSSCNIVSKYCRDVAPRPTAAVWRHDLRFSKRKDGPYMVPYVSL